MEKMDNISNNETEEPDLDPRIQVELEKLNSSTDEINKLEIELDEANTTFRMLLNESTRRLKLLGKKLGSCIDKARPYYEALEVAKKAQLECQKAAVLFQRANEIHAAAKETVALAEQRFMSNSHEWQFDNAWQEMLNHATIKVMDAENQKAASGREHQLRATLFNAAEQKVQQLEEKLRRHIIRSRPYFEEKTLCQEQLNTQKERIETLQKQVSEVKYTYSQSLKKLELISEEIHQKRKKENSDYVEIPSGPREPGVGAELNSPHEETLPNLTNEQFRSKEDLRYNLPKLELPNELNSGLTNLEFDIEDCHSIGNLSEVPSSTVSEKDENEDIEMDQELNELRLRVKQLAIRPVEGASDNSWANELSDTVNKLDHMLLLRECQNKNDFLSTEEAKFSGYKVVSVENNFQKCFNYKRNDAQKCMSPSNAQKSDEIILKVNSVPPSTLKGDSSLSTQILSPSKSVQNLSPAKSFQNLSPMKSVQNFSPTKSVLSLSSSESVQNLSPSISTQNLSPEKSVQNLSPAKSVQNLSPLKNVLTLSSSESVQNLSLAKSAQNLSPAKSVHNLSSVFSVQNINTLENGQNLSQSKSVNNLSFSKSVHDLSTAKHVPNLSTPDSIQNLTSSESSQKSVQSLSTAKSVQNLSLSKSGQNLSPLKSTQSLTILNSIQNLALSESLQNLSTSKSGQNLSPAKSGQNLSPLKSSQSLSTSNSNQNLAPSESTQNLSPSKSGQNLSPAKSIQNLSPSKSSRDLSALKSGQNLSTSENDRNLSPSKSSQNMNLLKNSQKEEIVLKVQNCAPPSFEHNFEDSKVENVSNLKKDLSENIEHVAQNFEQQISHLEHSDVKCVDFYEKPSSQNFEITQNLSVAQSDTQKVVVEQLNNSKGKSDGLSNDSVLSQYSETDCSNNLNTQNLSETMDQKCDLEAQNRFENSVDCDRELEKYCSYLNVTLEKCDTKK